MILPTGQGRGGQRRGVGSVPGERVGEPWHRALLPAPPPSVPHQRELW